MRILICGTMYLPDLNGQAIFTANLAEGMLARGHTVRVLMPGTRPYKVHDMLHGVEIVQIPSVQIGIIHKDLRLARFNRRTIRLEMDNFQPDLVHVQDPAPLCQAVMHEAHLRSIPVLATHHPGREITAPYLVKSPRLVKRITEWFTWRFFMHHLGQADIITVPSRSSAALLALKGLKKPAQPVSCGVQLKDFHPMADIDRAAVRERFGLDSNCFLVVYIGRLDIEKNVEVLVRAAALLKHPDIQLAFAGEGSLQTQLKKYTQRHNLESRVRWLGKVNHADLPALINCADLFAMPGAAESFSIATLEGMACGKPVLAANAGALPELVQHKMNGFLFEPYNPRDAACWLDFAADNPALLAEMGKISTEQAQHHRLENSLARFEQIYHSALRPAPVHPLQPSTVRTVLGISLSTRAYSWISMILMLALVGYSLFFIPSRSTSAQQILLTDVPALNLTKIGDLLDIPPLEMQKVSESLKVALEKGRSMPAFDRVLDEAEAELAKQAPAASQPSLLEKLGLPSEVVDFFILQPQSGAQTSPSDEAHGPGWIARHLTLSVPPFLDHAPSSEIR